MIIYFYTTIAPQSTFAFSLNNFTKGNQTRCLQDAAHHRPWLHGEDTRSHY